MSNQVIACTVVACQHNEHSYCALQEIEIQHQRRGPGGADSDEAAANAADTFCASFEPQ